MDLIEILSWELIFKLIGIALVMCIPFAVFVWMLDYMQWHREENPWGDDE